MGHGVLGGVDQCTPAFVERSASAGGGDPYETQIARVPGAGATSVPVYETVQTLDELQWILETGPGFHGYQGVIVTSKRAVDAWRWASARCCRSWAVSARSYLELPGTKCCRRRVTASSDSCDT